MNRMGWRGAFSGGRAQASDLLQPTTHRLQVLRADLICRYEEVVLLVHDAHRVIVDGKWKTDQGRPRCA